MDQKCDRLYPSAPLENIDLEQRLEKKLNDVTSFNIHNNNVKEMTAYFKDKNHKSRKIYKKYKTLQYQSHLIPLLSLPQHRVLLPCLLRELD